MNETENNRPVAKATPRRGPFFALGLGAVAAVAAVVGMGISGLSSQVFSQALTPKVEVPAEARALSRAFSGVAKALRPSVVRIDVETETPRAAQGPRAPRGGAPGRGDVPPEMREFFEKFFEGGEANPFAHPDPGRGTGSGMVLDGQGHILTNSHVVKKAIKVKVIFQDGKTYPARVVGMDDYTDVAVVKLEKAPGNLAGVRLGNSDQLETGEWVIAVGSPLGMDQTVTVGIVSSKGKIGRNMPGFGDQNNKVREYIQTDAKINPGNSGGPLLNLSGEVIGINTMINVGPGGAYGFAIPINQARRVAETLMKDGRVRYAYLGVSVGDLDELNPELRSRIKNAPERGALVSLLSPASPAEKAGLRSGDVITKLDDTLIEGKADVVSYVSSRPIGAPITIAFVRDGKPQTATAKLGEFRPDQAAAQGEPSATDEAAVGIALQDLSPDVARMLGLPETSKGAVITDVAPKGRGARAGLRAEDVILEVNREVVASASDAVTKIRAAKGPIMMRVRRGNQPPRIVVVPAS